MNELAPWVVPVTAAFAVVGTLTILWLVFRPRGGGGKSGGSGAGISQLPCSVCRRELVVHQAELVKLHNTECALVARTLPHTVGHHLAEYICPYCEASHCFQVEGKHLKWIGVNLYSPHTGSAHCMECRRPLRAPPWPAGTYDGKLETAPALQPEFGLVCGRCQAICCVECCSKATRNRAKDGTYFCPRCARGDVKALFHGR